MPLSCSHPPYSDHSKPGTVYFRPVILPIRRSQWPHGLRRRSAAACLLRSWVRIPPGAWIFVCWECCVLSGRGLSDELITRPEESYRLLCVVVCDLETSRMRRPWPALGRSVTEKKNSPHTASFLAPYSLECTYEYYKFKNPPPWAVLTSPRGYNLQTIPY